MGHSWRDMDPAGAAESDRLGELADKLMKQIKKLPAENLTVGELLDILDVYRPKYDMHDFDNNDAKVLQNILANTRKDHHCGH
jgi:hypothetical protein